MRLNELQNYDCWLTRNALEIFMGAKVNGGWKKVFPPHEKFPVWASKIRNHFNVLPKTLRRLPEQNAKHLLNRPQFLPFLVRARNDYWYNRYHRDYRPKPWGYDPPPLKVHPLAPAKPPPHIQKMPEREAMAQEHALSGDVYLDNLQRVWYQMSAGSTIYHWGDHPDSPTAEAVYWDTVMGQNDAEVFKLISPDDNGGSHEVIIYNAEVKDGPYNNRSERIGKVNVPIDVTAAIITDPILQGSYNYSETTTEGLSEHERRDVKPHVHSTYFYVNPANSFSDLASRRFPEKDREGKLLATQK